MQPSFHCAHLKVKNSPLKIETESVNPTDGAQLCSLLFWKAAAFSCTQVFKPRTPPEAIALCSRLLEYTPASRLSPLEACAHAFFDELRQPNTRLPSGRDLPMLFNFSTTGIGTLPTECFTIHYFVHYIAHLAKSSGLGISQKSRIMNIYHNAWV